MTYMAPTAEETASYLANNYGYCALTPCHCLVRGAGWLGTACLHWVPTTAKTWAELKSLQRAMYGAAR